jgi:hypothetical protein
MDAMHLVWHFDLEYHAICVLVPSKREETFKVRSQSEHGLLADYFVAGGGELKWEQSKGAGCVKICLVTMDETKNLDLREPQREEATVKPAQKQKQPERKKRKAKRLASSIDNIERSSPLL